MSFSLVNPTGWTTGDTLTETQINQLDAEHAAAIDGSGGGTYSLVSPLTLNGSTVTIATLSAGSLTATGTSSLNGNVTLGDNVADNVTSVGNFTCQNTLLVNSTSSFVGAASFGGNISVTGTSNLNGDVNIGNNAADTIACNGTITVYNDSSFGSTAADAFIVDATASFNGPAAFATNVSLGDAPGDIITVNGALTTNSSATLSSVTVTGDAALNGSITYLGNSSSDSCLVNSKIIFTGGGRLLNDGIIANNADQSIDITIYRHILIPSSNTAGHTYTLTGSVADGDWVFIRNADSSTSTIDGLISIPSLPTATSVYYLRISGTWCLMMQGT